MMTKALAFTSLLLPSLAAAEGLELSVGAGYSQGSGEIFGTMSNHDISNPGGAVALEVAYRMRPELALGVYGTVARHGGGDTFDAGSDVNAGTAGLQGTFHFRPLSSLDPWLSVGSGWKTFWFAPPSGNTTSVHGLELVRVQVGLDVRQSRRMAIAPVVGASLTQFHWQNRGDGMGLVDLNDRAMHGVAYAGIAGRFGL